MRFHNDAQRKAVFANMNEFAAEGMSTWNPFTSALPQSILPDYTPPKIKPPEITVDLPKAPSQSFLSSPFSGGLPQSFLPEMPSRVKLPPAKQSGLFTSVTPVSMPSPRTTMTPEQTQVMMESLYPLQSFLPKEEYDPFKFPEQRTMTTQELIKSGKMKVEFPTIFDQKKSTLKLTDLPEELKGRFGPEPGVEDRPTELRDIVKQKLDTARDEYEAMGFDKKMSMALAMESQRKGYLLDPVAREAQLGISSPAERTKILGEFEGVKKFYETEPDVMKDLEKRPYLGSPWKSVDEIVKERGITRTTIDDTKPDVDTVVDTQTQVVPYPVSAQSSWLLPAAALAGGYILASGMGGSRHVRRVYPEDEDRRRR